MTSYVACLHFYTCIMLPECIIVYKIRLLNNSMITSGLKIKTVIHKVLWDPQTLCSKFSFPLLS